MAEEDDAGEGNAQQRSAQGSILFRYSAWLLTGMRAGFRLPTMKFCLHVTSARVVIRSRYIHVLVFWLRTSGSVTRDSLFLWSFRIVVFLHAIQEGLVNGVIM
jgi:hypothetical protein